MNRQLSGWLAWGALAFVIAVPSAEVVFSGDKENGVSANVLDQQTGMQNSQLDSGPLPQATAGTNSKVRLVGANGIGSTAPHAPESDLVDLPNAPRYAKSTTESLLGDLEQPVAIESKLDADGLIQGGAPIPQPTIVRTASVPRVISATSSFEDDVRRSIVTIQSGGNITPVQPNGQNSGPVDNFSQFGTSKPNRDVINDDATDSAFFRNWQGEQGTQGFTQSGSFTEQLPNRRGDGVRLDLLQQ